MRLSNITLATIFIALFTTGPVTSSVSEARAMFQKLAREAEAAKKEPQPGPNGRKQPLTEPTPATASTKTTPSSTARSTVRSYPPPPSHPKSTGSSSTKSSTSPGPTVKPTATLPSKSTPPPPKSAESTRKPVQVSAKKPTVTPQPKQPSPPRVPPAPKQTATSSQPATGRQAPAPLIPPPGPPTMTPSEFEEQQQASRRSTAQASKAPQSTTSGVSNVAKLTSMWGGSVPSSKPTSSSSASPSKPTPRPAPHTSSKPSGAPPKATSIPGDTNFVRFKEAIKQGKYFDAIMIDMIYGILSDPSPSTLKSYGEFLAGFDVPKILNVTVGWLETLGKISDDEYESERLRYRQEADYIVSMGEGPPEDYDPDLMRSLMLTLGLFLMHASDEKFNKLLEGLGQAVPKLKKDLLSFSVPYSRNVSPGSLPRLFKALTKEDQAETLDEAANAMFRSGEPESFDALIVELQHGGALDKDSANFAFNIAFGLACKNNDRSLAQRYFQSTRIFSSTYRTAILDSYDDKRSTNEVFDWLLKNAGRDDLFDLQYKAPWKISDTLEKAFEAVKYKFRTHGTQSL